MQGRRRVLGIFCLSFLGLAGCGPHSPSRWTSAQRQAILRLELPPSMTAPPDPTDKYADNPQAALLGQRIFFDGRFSSNGMFSCSVCHLPAQDFTDGRPVAQGLSTGTRNVPSIVGVSFSHWFFWDGRKDSQWAQAVGPIENPAEMNFDRVEAVRFVLNDSTYKPEYEAVFGPLPTVVNDPACPKSARPDPKGAPATPEGQAWESLTPEDQTAITTAYANLGKAVEAYERKLMPQPAPFDSYAEALRQGQDRTDILTEQELQGLGLFIGEAGCVNCHQGPRFTDDAFHNLGLPLRPNEDPNNPDPGRGIGAHEVLTDEFNCASPYSDDNTHCDELKYLDPNFPDFYGAFKTPSLRNVAETAPYMHGGQEATLADVLAFYSALPGLPALGHRELTLKPLHLTADQQAAIVAFLGTLTGGAQPANLTEAPR